MSPSIWDIEYSVLRSLLREVRETLQLSQGELAKRLNKPQSYVSKYENGDRRLDIIELKKICEACNLSLSQFCQLFEQEVKKNA